MLHEFGFTSGIADEMALDYHEVVFLSHSWHVVRPGWSRNMAAEEVHTVEIPQSKTMPFTAWLVEESYDRIESLMYSPLLDPPLRNDGLYEPMSCYEAYETLLVVCEAMGNPWR